MKKQGEKSKINHFGHIHPLNLTKLSDTNLFSSTTICSACKLDCPFSSTVYVCANCNYFLHPSCADMKKNIQHPVDKDHLLSLLIVPPYKSEQFTCKACCEPGTGFLYHCSICNIDVHTYCADLPTRVDRPDQHEHGMELYVSKPYWGLGFTCDVCLQPGGLGWRYACKSCQFDAHPGCVLQELPQQSGSQEWYFV